MATLTITPISRGLINNMSVNRQAAARQANSIVRQLRVNPNYDFRSLIERWQGGNLTLTQVGDRIRHSIQNYDELVGYANLPNHVYNFVRSRINEAILELIADIQNQIIRHQASRIECLNQQVATQAELLERVMSDIQNAAENYVLGEDEALVAVLERYADI